MKIEFGPKASRVMKGSILVIAVVMLGIVAYAAVNLTINNTGTVTIANKNIQGITFSPPSSQPTCLTQTTYSDAPSAIAWGNIAQGSASNGYICVKNLGGTGTTYAVSTTVAPPAGITVTYNGTATLTSTPLLTGQTSLINVVVNVSLSTIPGSFSYTTLIN